MAGGRRTALRSDPALWVAQTRNSGRRSAVRAPYHPRVPRSWTIAMAILIVCLIASIAIGASKLL